MVFLLALPIRKISSRSRLRIVSFLFITEIVPSFCTSTRMTSSSAWVLIAWDLGKSTVSCICTKSGLITIKIISRINVMSINGTILISAITVLFLCVLIA